MEQKVIITNSESTIQQELSNGWRVKSVTAGHVSSHSGGGNTYSSSGKEHGKFLIVLEK
jgi:hypothetical protein